MGFGHVASCGARLGGNCTCASTASHPDPSDCRVSPSALPDIHSWEMVERTRRHGRVVEIKYRCRRCMAIQSSSPNQGVDQ